jgi:methanogenic corrinoid protein MtbC1
MVESRMRIGELSRRVGVSPELLRAWETRYGLLEPERTAGGFRLYGNRDEQRVRAMQGHLARRLPASEAARLTLAGDEPPEPAGDGTLEHDRAELAAAFEAFDEGAANRVLDRLTARFTVETMLRDAIVPYLHDLGESWARGETRVSQEHYASNVIQSRLLALARGWGEGSGPLALIGCVPGEQHTLGLIAFGLALHRRGWRLAYLGADTPIEEVALAADRTQPDVIVLSAVVPRRLTAIAEDLRSLARRHRVAIGGAAASSPVVERVGCRPLLEDPVSAAATLAAAPGS